MIEERKERNLDDRAGHESEKRGIILCNIKQIFQSEVWINTNQVAAIEEMPEGGELNLMHLSLSDAQINNWEFKDLPWCIQIVKCNLFFFFFPCFLFS